MIMNLEIVIVADFYWVMFDFGDFLGFNVF